MGGDVSRFFKSKPADAVSFVALGCTHDPLIDPDFLRWSCELIQEIRPQHLIHLGDAHEAKSAAKWPNEYGWSLEDEYRGVNNTLQSLRKSAPDECKLVLLPGNHDDNLICQNRFAKDLRSLLDWRVPQHDSSGRLINEEIVRHWSTNRQYAYSRRKGCYRIGNVAFVHGYEAGGSSDESQAIYFCDQNGLLVSAHTHRPTPGGPKRANKTKTIPLPYYYLNTGCGRLMECDYMMRKRQQLWGQALVYGWAKLTHGPRQSITWDARCELFRMFDDVN